MIFVLRYCNSFKVFLTFLCHKPTVKSIINIFLHISFFTYLITSLMYLFRKWELLCSFWNDSSDITQMFPIFFFVLLYWSDFWFLLGLSCLVTSNSEFWFEPWTEREAWCAAVLGITESDMTGQNNNIPWDVLCADWLWEHRNEWNIHNLIGKTYKQTDIDSVVMHTYKLESTSVIKNKEEILCSLNKHLYSNTPVHKYNINSSFFLPFFLCIQCIYRSGTGEEERKSMIK